MEKWVDSQRVLWGRQGMQVKIKRYSDGRFVVKTRLHPDFDQKQGKKSGKNKRRNKKNSSKRKSDSPSAIWKISSSGAPPIRRA